MEMSCPSHKPYIPSMAFSGLRPGLSYFLISLCKADLLFFCRGNLIMVAIIFELIYENTKKLVIDDHLLGNSSQIVMTSEGRGTNSRKKRAKAYLPYAFTEHGVSMLASVLKSEKAVRMSIAIVRAFIAGLVRDIGKMDDERRRRRCQLVAAVVVASADGRTMSVVLPVRQLSGSWLRTRDMAWYNSGSSWRKLTELSKKTSTATAQNSW